jgi:hypothetical protein
MMYKILPQKNKNLTIQTTLKSGVNLSAAEGRKLLLRMSMTWLTDTEYLCHK